MPNESLTLRAPGSSPVAALPSGCRNWPGELVSFQAGAASHAIMVEKRHELRIAQKEGQDVEAGLARRWPRDDDASRRRAPEVGNRIGDDLASQVRQARVGIGAMLVGDDSVHHPVSHVPGWVAEAALQGDRPGDGGLD